MTLAPTLHTVPRPAPCHPDRPHYAKELCQSCYRRQHNGTNFQSEKYGDRLPTYRTTYEAKPKAQQRQQRYYRARKAIGQVLGLSMPLLSKVFADPQQIARLQIAHKNGNETLADAWSDLTPKQQHTIQ